MSQKSGSQAVVRALRLLKLFDDNHPYLTIAQAVDATGLNRTTVFRLLTALTTEGFLTRLSDGSFGLGPESMALGGYALRHNRLWQVAHPILTAFVEEVDERATLEVPSYSPTGVPSMLVVDEIAGSHRLGIRNFVGEHLPIHATSTGKAVMAHMPPAEREALLELSFEQLTAQTLVSRDKLTAELDTITDQGYATAFEELEMGLIACAVPIFNMRREVCAAISFVGPTLRIDRARVEWLLQRLVTAGARISGQLGYVGVS